MGPSFLFLYAVENYKNKITDFLLVFGRVPLYFYFIHVFFIHLLAIIGMLIFGGNWHMLILNGADFSQDLITYGYSMAVVYVVWIFIIIIYIHSVKNT